MRAAVAPLCEQLETRMMLAAQLTITPTTWNIVGLDSNKVNVGPNTFLSGVRVKNIGDEVATNVTSEFKWDSFNQYINIRSQDNTVLSIPSLAPGASQDFYYTVEVTRTSLAHNTARRFHIEATADGLGIVSTPTPREIYVEKFVSQNRNDVTKFSGPTSGLMVGQEYEYIFEAKTSSSYPELSIFPTFTNNIFQVLSINTTYSTPSGATNDKFWADAGGWDSDPTSPTYRSVVGPANYTGGKVGGTIKSTIRVKVIGKGSTNLLPMILDVSGNSFHYNADFNTDFLAVNNPPTAVNDAYNVSKDNTLTVAAAGVLSNDFDTDGDPITAVLQTGPTKGTLTFNTNGSFTYKPNTNFTGTDTFTYKAKDNNNALSNLATVTINVGNAAPVAVDDGYLVDEDETLIVSAAGVLANDTDADGNALTAIKLTNPSNGSVTFNSDGSFTYTPSANFNGADSFTYKANDGTADSNTATVNITVRPKNDPPVAINDEYATDEDTPLNIPASGVLGNDSDIDGDALSASLVTGPSHGSLSLNADGSFTYTPNANFHGPDSFTYKANDGTANSNVATVTISVRAVNDPPEAVDDGYATNEDTTLDISASGVLGNDSDIDGDALSASLVTGPSHGSLSLNADGSFTYTPNANFHGTDSFTYKANDGTADSNVATVTITVYPQNDPPVAADDAYGTDEDTPLNISAAGVLGNDSDLDGDALSAVLVTGPSHGSLTLNPDGSFTYTPDLDYVGSDSFTYMANDGLADSNVATVRIDIGGVNDDPADIVLNSGAANENDEFHLEGTFTDADPEDAHTVTIKWNDGSPDTVIQLDPGVFSFEASHRYLDDNPTGTGSDIYTAMVTITDSAGGSDTSSTEITVNNVAPTVLLGNPLSLDEGDGFIRIGRFTDPGTLDTWTATVDYGDGSGVQALTLSANKTFTLSHLYADGGIYTVIVTVTDDDGMTGVQTLQVNVNNVAPTLTLVGSQTAKVNVPLSLTNLGLITDPGSDSFTYSINWGDGTTADVGAATIDVAGDPSLGLLTEASFDGTHTYTKKGRYTVTVTVLDDDGGSSTATFVVMVK